MRRQQGLHLLTEGLVGRAPLAQEAVALLCIDFERGMEDRLDRLQPRRIHVQSALRSSAYSQARENVQSRLTVITEIFITSAISSCFRPPKYLSSTTRALR